MKARMQFTERSSQRPYTVRIYPSGWEIYKFWFNFVYNGVDTIRH